MESLVTLMGIYSQDVGVPARKETDFSTTDVAIQFTSQEFTA